MKGNYDDQAKTKMKDLLMELSGGNELFELSRSKGFKIALKGIDEICKKLRNCGLLINSEGAKYLKI